MPSSVIIESNPSIELETMIAKKISAQHAINKYGFVTQNSVVGDCESDKIENDGKSLKIRRSTLSTKIDRILSYQERMETDNIEIFSENLSVKKLRSRELKWIEMMKQGLAEWKSFPPNKIRKLKDRCRKGIPQSIRSQAWMQLSGALKLKTSHPTYYLDCLQNSDQIDISIHLDAIVKDLHRQFPTHELISKPEGQDMLFNVLKAYAAHYPEIGYCQAQCPLAALLLTQMPEEDAFFMLIKISDEYLQGYFKRDFETLKVDGEILQSLLKKEDAFIHKKFTELDMSPQLYMTEWFLCLFVRTLPWCTVLRIWDMFFFEGKIVLFKVAIYLIRFAFKDRTMLAEKCREGLVEVLGMLKNSMTIESLKESNLVREINAINITYDDLRYLKQKIYGRNFSL